MMNLNRNDAYLSTFKRSFSDIEQSKGNFFTPQVNAKNLTLTAGVYESMYAIAAIFDGDYDRNIQSTNFIEIRFVEILGKSCIVFILKDVDLLDQFISFAIDLESELSVNPEATVVDLANRYSYWVELFRLKKERLNESIIKGLINELLLITDFFVNQYSIDDVVTSWVGPNSMKKDFALNDGTWFETKAVNYGKDTVTISSVEQLKSDTVGYLAIGDYEKTSPFNTKGINLKKAAEDVLRLISSKDTESKFLQKLKLNGFEFDELMDGSSYLNEYRYIFKGFRFYIVDDSFPKLHKEDLSSAISKVKYDLTISKLIDYLVEF